ncbi:MAG: hypothetical protein OEM02_16975 [Desulfobulbaceae bacterium]|nr:hypothetical protein [Desulfobulbaceae bacterium]
MLLQKDNIRHLMESQWKVIGIHFGFILFILLLGLIWIEANVALAGNIEVKKDQGQWHKADSVELVYGQEVQLKVKKVEGSRIRWYQIIPDINKRYNNAVWPWLPNAYQWKGFDKIKYHKKHLVEYDNQWQINPFIGQPKREAEINFNSLNSSLWEYIKRRMWPIDLQAVGFGQPYLGSFWYGVEIEKDGRLITTTSIEHSDNRGLSPKVFRVSIKKGNDLLGNLTGYFNVPAVFGSTPYQVRNYIGVDCADVLMAAYCHAKNIAVEKDYNVAMLTSKFPKVVKANMDFGVPDKNIQWGKDIKPGDFIAVRHSSNAQFIHIGALYDDANNDGLLNGTDIVLHAGPDPLHFSTLDSGAFDGTIVILRPTENEK